MDSIIFDFDGLIIDTESAAIESWKALYLEHGVDFPHEEFSSLIGTSHATFDPLGYLVERCGGNCNAEEIWKEQRRYVLDDLITLKPLPGIEQLLSNAKSAKIPIGLSSSSTHSWVESNLHRLDLLKYFKVITCSDDVELTKPDPALYRLSVEKLGANPKLSIALEDSNHGVIAAKRAGLKVVAIPNRITSKMDFSQADLQVSSAQDISINTLNKLLT